MLLRHAKLMQNCYCIIIYNSNNSFDNFLEQSIVETDFSFRSSICKHWPYAVSFWELKEQVLNIWMKEKSTTTTTANHHIMGQTNQAYFYTNQITSSYFTNDEKLCLRAIVHVHLICKTIFRLLQNFYCVRS